MKSSQLLALGVVAFSISSIAAGSPAPSPTLVHKKNSSPYEARAPVPCLIGTGKCSARNDPPMRACQLGGKGGDSCSIDGAKIIDAGTH